MTSVTFAEVMLRPAAPVLSASCRLQDLQQLLVAERLTCDLNFRKNLWRWGKSASTVMRELLKYVDIAIASEEAVQLQLGITVDVDPSSGKLDQAQYEALAGKILSEFPNLKAAINLRSNR